MVLAARWASRLHSEAVLVVVAAVAEKMGEGGNGGGMGVQLLVQQRANDWTRAVN